MINRTYIVKMPSETPTNPLDILVQSSPGTNAVPISPAGGGIYYEWRGRLLRFEQLKLLSTGASNPAWVARGRLGLMAFVQSLGQAAIQTDVPDLQLSASFGTFAASGMAVPAVADSTSGGPLIRLIGGANTSGKFYMVTLLIAEQRDEDLSPTGR